MPNREGTTLEVSSLLSDTVRSCKRLVKLNRPPLLNSAAWKYFSNLPTLDTLSIFGSSVLGSFALLDQDDLDFLNVRTFSFYTRMAADATTVIQRPEFPSLKKFALYFDNSSLEHNLL
ncbi:hypothetical protein AZE42_09924 [Rhizopogon vesiculosus]|uniref:F-box domain-containing protein n=1 Tax=Rhizopogon vesiculosus TaxID=180088 RepID=A0A1J8Q5S9_9AGAM|nr:hypothetical protein AZE42_09924 [Rhizopogon vesiculosus]